MSKKVETWMPLLVDKYLGDTTHLTTEQHGAYLLLLMALWKREGVLPAKEDQLASIARMPAAKWKASREVLLEFFRPTEDGRGLTQKRLTEELLRARAHNDKKSEAGAKGAAKRWHKDAAGDGTGNASANGTGMAEALADGKQEAWQTGAPIPIPKTSSLPDPASAVSSRGEVGQALKSAGVDMTQVGMTDPRIDALLAQGATPAEFGDVALEAVKRGITKPLGWICTAMVGRRAEAAKISASPGATPQQRGPAAPNATTASDAAERTAEMLRQQSNRGHTAPPAALLARRRTAQETSA